MNLDKILSTHLLQSEWKRGPLESVFTMMDYRWNTQYGLYNLFFNCKIMKSSVNSYVIGIDVSKKTLDIYVSSSGKYHKILNEYSIIVTFLKSISSIGDYIIYYESTGIYSNTLAKVCNDLSISHYQINPLITYKLIDGLSDRNKNDKIDSFKLAEIGAMLLSMHENGSKLKLVNPCSNQLVELNNCVSMVHSLRNHISRFKQVIDRIKSDIFLGNRIVKFYEKNIKEFEIEIDKLYLKAEKKIKVLGLSYSLDNLTSIPTISRSLSIELVILFINLKSKGIGSNDRSKLKAYVGIDPTERKSGSALNRVTISRRGKKHIRCLLYMSGIKWYQLIKYDKYTNTDLGKFFIRMKNKFTTDTVNKRGKSVITAMSKKILLTAWGIFWNDTEYNWS